MDGWKTSFLFGWPIFRCFFVSGSVAVRIVCLSSFSSGFVGGLFGEIFPHFAIWGNPTHRMLNCHSYTDGKNAIRAGQQIHTNLRVYQYSLLPSLISRGYLWTFSSHGYWEGFRITKSYFSCIFVGRITVITSNLPSNRSWSAFLCW